MFAIDPKLIARLAPGLRRVLIVDPNPATARLLGDLLKSLGAREVLVEGDERAAYDLCRDFEPQILFVDYVGPHLDGPAFVRKLRRSHLQCRKSPVVLVSSTATAESIKAARDSGVHEYLRKPFTAGDLLKRVEVVVLKPRNWVEAVAYIGPDRRRFNSADYQGPRKRKQDGGKGETSPLEQSVRILRAAVEAFHIDREQALRAMTAQIPVLRQGSASLRNAQFHEAATMIAFELASPNPSCEVLVPPVMTLVRILGIEASKPDRKPEPPLSIAI